MTLILTEAGCLALTVRGDVPGVLDGYVGPALQRGDDQTVIAVFGRAFGADDDRFDTEYRSSRYRYSACQSASHLRLPLANPLVQAHIVGWLGRGARCAPCDGLGRRAAGTLASCECSPCKGTGYLRPRFNCYSWLTPEAHEGLPDWIRMALIWGSVVRVAAGAGPLRDVVAPWSADESASGRPGADQANQRMMGLGHALIDETPTGRVIRFEVPDGR